MESSGSHLKKVYLWMMIGLLVTAVTSFIVSVNVESFEFLFQKGVFYGLIIFELVLVFILGSKSVRFSAGLSTFLFMLYSFANGLTFSVILLAYTGMSVFTIFLTTAGMFLGLSILGYTTKKDLSGFGLFLYAALIGLIIATIINLFFFSSMVYFVLNVIGVLIFAGLTVYDTQKIKNNPEYAKFPILGALELYLDFINLFLNLLRLFGNRK